MNEEELEALREQLKKEISRQEMRIYDAQQAVFHEARILQKLQTRLAWIYTELDEEPNYEHEVH